MIGKYIYSILTSFELEYYLFKLLNRSLVLVRSKVGRSRIVNCVKPNWTVIYVKVDGSDDGSN